MTVTVETTIVFEPVTEGRICANFLRDHPDYTLKGEYTTGTVVKCEKSYVVKTVIQKAEETNCE